MEEVPSPITNPVVITDSFGTLGRILLRVSRFAAIGGALIFVALIVMSVISIVGRKLFGFVVPGDVEILEMGAAFGSSTFFAYCHLTQSDIKVDFFTHNMAQHRIALLDACGSLMVGLFGALIAWRTAVGALSLKAVGETSDILSFPLWIAQGLMVPGFALMSVAGFYMCFQLLQLASRRMS